MSDQISPIPQGPEEFIHPTTPPIDNPSLAEQAVYKRSFELGKAMWENQELRHDATHDELTGLLNLKGFNQALEKCLEEHSRGERPEISFLFIDGTNVKAANDKLGYAEGDKAIIGTAAVLTRSTREEDVIARIGGDEFVIIPQPRKGESPLEDLEPMRSRIANETAAFLETSPHLAAIGFDIAVGVSEWKGNFEATKAQAEQDMKLHKAEQHAEKGQHRPG